MKNYLFILGVFSQMPCLAGSTPCETATLISCGQTINATTINGTSQLDNNQYFDCVNTDDPYDGNDVAFKILVEERKVIHLYLKFIHTIDLDMYLFPECTEKNECLASSYEWNAFEEIFTESIEYIAEPGVYYLLIDGKESDDNGAFSVTYGCACSCAEELNPLFARSIRCENFDEYEEASIDPQSNRWRKWKLSDDAGEVEVMGSEQMLRLTSALPVDNVYYSLSDLRPGRHRISWKMFIEEGATGAYSFLDFLPDEFGNLSDPVYDVYFRTLDRGRVVMNGDTVSNFTYDGGNWNDVMQIVDPLLDTIEIWINNQFVFGSKYSTGAIAPFKISGMRFFTIANSNYLIDHICVWEKGDPIIVKCEGDSVCTSNGASFANSCEAERALYTDLEFSECGPVFDSLTVCDYGGSAIYRSDVFISVFSPDDEFPGTVLTNECVIAAFGGSIPADHRVQIKVYYNDLGENINPQFSQEDIRLFVFQCFYNPESNAITQIYIGEVNGGNEVCPEFDIGETRVKGFYYLAAVGRIGTQYSLQIFPSGDCQGDFNELKCDTVINEVLPVDNNFDLNSLGDYSRCYNGTRTYTGGDMVFRFDITSPTRVNIRLTASDQKAIFLYNFLCARNCLDYSETPPGGGTAEILNVTLLTGRYYVIVDRESTSNESFSLTMECIPDVTVIPYIFNSGDTICPVEDQAGNIHRLNIPTAASHYLKNGTYVAIGYADLLGNKKNVIIDPWTAPESMEFLLPQDSIGDSEKCAYLLNDTISITLHTPYNGSDYLTIFCEATYEDLIPSVITAKGNYIPLARSVVDSLFKINQVSFTVNPTYQNFSAQAQSTIFTVFSYLGYTITKDPAATWLDLNYVPGVPEVTVNLDANAIQEKRETDLLVTINTDPPVYSTIHISQNAPCIDPVVNLVTSTGEDTFCEGETVYLIADVINGSEEFYSFDWNNNDSLHQIAFPAQLNVNNFTVTVTEKKCFESANAAININVIDAPSVDAGPNITVCPGAQVELNATSTVAGEYKWSNGQATSQIFVYPKEETTYRVSVTVAGEECDGIDSVTVYMHPVAVWTINPDSLIKCKGDVNGQLSIGSDNQTTPQTIHWSNDAITSAISNLTPGSYSVTVTDIFGCSHIDTFDLAEPAEEIQFSVPVIIHPVGGNNGEIQVTVSGGIGPYVFAWYNSSNVIVGNNATLMNQPPGCYTLVVTDALGCSAQLGCIELITSTIVLGDNLLEVFPNPTEGKIFIRCKQPTADRVDWKIFDLLGRPIKNGSWSKAQEINEVIDLEGNGLGYYLLTFESGNYRAMEIIILF